MDLLRQPNKDANKVEITSEEIKQVMAKFKTLTYFGFGVFGGEFLLQQPMNCDVSKKANEFRSLRNELISAIDEVSLSYDFIANKPMRKTLNTWHSSYGMKHMVENWTKSHAGGRKYIANGSFIVAAAIAGFTVKQCHPMSPNCRINISEKAFK